VNPIDPAELSAYLDGELTAARARAVEAALASSPELRGELNSLMNADHTWRAAAGTAFFRPRVRLRPGDTPRSALGVAGVLVLLVVARVVPKLASTLEVELILNGVALAIVLIWVLRTTGRDQLSQSA
jgi:anti-sigma factor RsiW